MALNTPVPGLRHVRHNANSPKRVELVIPALAELDVPEEVAAQLVAADPHFEVAPQTPAPQSAKTAAKRSGKTPAKTEE